MLEELRQAVGEVGLEFHMGKTKVLKNAQGRKQSHATSVNIGGEQVGILAPTESTKYLGRALSLNDYQDREIKHRIAAGWAKFTTYKTELCDRKIPLDRRLKLFEAVVTPTVLYASGCWTMTAERENRLKVARRRMLRKIGQVPRWRICGEDGGPEDWVSYIVRSTYFVEEKGAKAGVADWVKEQRRRKWRWAGHVARLGDRRWTKLALDWMPSGVRRQGRPTTRWEDTLKRFEEEHLNGQRWDAVAKDRSAWKNLEDCFVNQ